MATKKCDRMQLDMENIADLGVGLMREKKMTFYGTSIGTGQNQILYKLSCSRKRSASHDLGPCATYNIERSGPGAKGLKKKTGVGNIYGLMQQLSRDAARAWCGPISKTTGFEGARKKRRRK